MIDGEDLSQALHAIGFVAQGQKHVWGAGSSQVRVDFGSGQLEYPDALIVNDRQTCNFGAAENFVVLDCLVRLLDKGYKPEHIELEPRWQLGRGGSGGRADILVKDNRGKALLPIECKTPGIEFKRAWTKTQQDGTNGRKQAILQRYL